MSAAFEALDLMTYNGEDPYLIHEPACQYCRAKLSEKPLTRCSTCSVVWYCSEVCVQADSDRHGWSCHRIAAGKSIMEDRVQELHEQHDIEDPCLPRKSIPKAAREAHERFQLQVQSLAKELSILANQVDTEELWEAALEFNHKAWKMSDSSSRDRFEAGTAFILIRLGRLDDAWNFIREFMVTQSQKGDCEKQIDGWFHAWERENNSLGWLLPFRGSNKFGTECTCYSDCVTVVRSCYPIGGKALMRDEFDYLILALLIIKMRIRVSVARDAWKDMVDSVFLNTDAGKELVPASLALAEMFSISDDTKQIEQIQELMVIIHSLNPALIPMFLNNGSAYVPNVHNIGVACLMRTPEGPEFLSAELERESFLSKCQNEPLAAIQRKADGSYCSTITKTEFLWWLLFAPTILWVAYRIFLYWLVLSYTWVGYLSAFANAVAFCAALWRLFSTCLHHSDVETTPRAQNAVFLLVCDITYVVIMEWLFSFSLFGHVQVAWWRCFLFVPSPIYSRWFATDEGPEIWRGMGQLSFDIIFENLYLISMGWLFLSLGHTAMIVSSMVLALFSVAFACLSYPCLLLYRCLTR